MTPDESPTESRAASLPVQLLLEVAIGVLLAAVIVLAAFASSHAISFVYGGY